jgi:LPXTG-motif cell wall-anchored protein
VAFFIAPWLFSINSQTSSQAMFRVLPFSGVVQTALTSSYQWRESIMRSKPGVIILVIGLGLLVASLFADSIGIGDDAGFGPQQTMATAAGVVITALGLLFTFKKKKDED